MRRHYWGQYGRGMGNLANTDGVASPELPGPERPGPELPGQRADASPTGARATPIHGLTVREALVGAPSLAGARVVAGARGLDRVVRRVNVMEVPDILAWVKPGELLLTTGYPLRNTPQSLTDLVVALDELGLAALAVKLHRYLDALPKDMVAEADRRGLPVILLPDAVAFDDVLTQVLTAMLNRQTAGLARIEEMHRGLVAIVLDGGGLEELAREVASVMAGPILLTTSDGRVLAEAGDADVLEGLRTEERFDPTGRLRTERLRPGLSTDPRLGSAAVVPIVAGRIDHGRIVGFGLDRRLDDGDIQLLERAATVAALVVTKELAVTAVQDKYRGDFLRDLLTGRAGSADEVTSHCTSLGWSVEGPVVVVVAELSPGPVPSDISGLELRPAQERFSAAFHRVVRRHHPTAPVAGFMQEVVAILPVPERTSPEELVRDLVREVSGDGGGGRRPFTTGVSRAVTGPDRIPDAYAQARRAMHVSAQLHGTGSTAHFDSLGVYRVLSLVSDPAELRAFVTETLQELARDDDEAADLRHTLQVLLDTNLNVAVAARMLHFHYNTLRYRIGKLERLVGPFTTDAALRLDLALAMKALQMQSLR